MQVSGWAHYRPSIGDDHNPDLGTPMSTPKRIQGKNRGGPGQAGTGLVGLAQELPSDLFPIDFLAATSYFATRRAPRKGSDSTRIRVGRETLWE